MLLSKGSTICLISSSTFPLKPDYWGGWDVFLCVLITTRKVERRKSESEVRLHSRLKKKSGSSQINSKSHPLCRNVPGAGMEKSQKCLNFTFKLFHNRIKDWHSGSLSAYANLRISLRVSACTDWNGRLFAKLGANKKRMVRGWGKNTSDTSAPWCASGSFLKPTAEVGLTLLLLEANKDKCFLKQPLIFCLLKKTAIIYENYF